jgi:hypothetical protein
LGGIVSSRLRNRVRKLAAGINGTEQNIHKGVSTLLPRQPREEDRLDVGMVDPAFDDHRAHRMQNHNSIVAVVGRRRDQCFPTVPKSEILPVARIAIDSDVSLSGICIRKDKTDALVLRGIRNLGRIEFVQDGGDGDTAGVEVRGNGREWINEVREFGGAASPAHREGTDVASSIAAAVGTSGIWTSIRSKDPNT